MKRLWQALRAFWAVLFPRSPKAPAAPALEWTVRRLSKDGSVDQEWRYPDPALVDERVRHESEKGFAHEVLHPTPVDRT